MKSEFKLFKPQFCGGTPFERRSETKMLEVGRREPYL